MESKELTVGSAEQKKITTEQKELMVNFLQERPQMYTGKFTPQYTRANSKALWEELATKLNALPYGAVKEWKVWRKTWTDIKKNSKNKLSKAKQYQGGTGGGPPIDPDITDMDNKILEMISPVCLGDPDVPEPELLEDAEVVLADDFDIHEDNENNQLSHPRAPLTKPLSARPTRLKRNSVETPEKPNNLGTPTINKPCISGMTQTNKVRVTKTTRLANSVRNNQRFLQMSEENLADTKEYHARKLEILSKYYEQKAKNDYRQSVALESIALSISEIADNLF